MELVSHTTNANLGFHGVGHLNLKDVVWPAQVRMWNNLPCAVFESGMLNRFEGAANCWVLPSLSLF